MATVGAPGGERSPAPLVSFSEEELPVSHVGRDPQLDLVRRYARILRSAPAEALRAQHMTHSRPGALTDKRAASRRAGAAARPAQTA
jgi:hypothetical protein